MTDWAVDIKDELVGAGIGTFGASSGWGIYISLEPNRPHTTVTLYPGGFSLSNPKFLIDDVTLQIRIRGAPNGYQAAMLKALDIRNALLGLPKKIINGTQYTGIWLNTDITLLKYDETERPILITNWRIVREPASGTYRVSAR
jgi:hypothetical protein